MLRKLTLLLSSMILLVGCSKSMDDYIGLWQEDDAKSARYLEIKKEGGVYLLVEQPFVRNKSYALQEKENRLFIESTPLTLSDDGKKLYIKSRNFQKVVEPKKVYDHQAQCVALNEEYKTAFVAVKPKAFLPTKEEAAAQEAVNRQFLEKFDTLEKQGLCVEVPFNIKVLRRQAAKS